MGKIVNDPTRHYGMMQAFSPFPTMFSKAYIAHATQSRVLKTLRKEPVLENIVGKGENTGYQHFLLSPQCFLFYPTHFQLFEAHGHV